MEFLKLKFVTMRLKLFIIIMLAVTSVFGQNNSPSDFVPLSAKKQIIKHSHSVGVSLFMLQNFFPESADYFLFTYGYRLSQKDRVFIEFNSWKYSEPLGTYGHSKELYPGYVRAFGFGLGYQRFHWKGLFTVLEATPFIKQYYDENNNKTQKGFQLYLQLMAGYRFEFFKNRFYIEPAFALKYWPIDTNFPSDFEKIEEGAPKFRFEPSLNFGFKF